MKNGKVQKKNRHRLSPDVYCHDTGEIVLQRNGPAKGFYHAVSVSDVKRFIAIIPDWDVLSHKLRAIILTSGGDWCFGRYNNAGVIKLDAWPKNES